MEKTLRLLSHLKWLFLIWMLVLIVLIFINVPNVNITQIGTVIFLCGIFMGLESLGDSSDLTAKEIALYSNKRYVIIQSSILIAGAITVLIISLFFLSLRFIFPSMNADLLDNFSELAFDCMALMLGFLCMIKQMRDKETAYKNSIN